MDGALQNTMNCHGKKGNTKIEYEQKQDYFSSMVLPHKGITPFHSIIHETGRK